MIVIVCPGQGSQTEGFLRPWVAESRFRERFEALSDEIQLDLVTHGTKSNSETLRDTAIAQPLITAASIVAGEALLDEGRDKLIGGIAGHSVGEIAAAVCAGILSVQDAMRFVVTRGQEMARVATETRAGMSAVIGGNEADLLTLLDSLGLEAANFNGGGQIVVAGRVDALEELASRPPVGSRVIPLPVAGAFHSQLMEPATEALRAFSHQLTIADPKMTIWTNVDGGTVTSGSTFVDLVVGQVSSPVRWDLCMNAFSAAGITGLVELTPAGVLTGLSRRTLKGVPTIAIKSPDDLEAAIALLP